MKNEEDEAFDELARKQGSWGGGFKAKQAMAADKQHWNEDEWRRNNWRCGHGWLRGEQCKSCNAAQEPYDQTALELCNVCGWKTLIPDDCCLNCERTHPAQNPVAHVYLFDHEGRPRIAWDKTKGIKIGDKLYTTPPLPVQRQPLTDERLDEIHASLFQGPFDPEDILNMRVAARAIEAAHNIGDKP